MTDGAKDGAEETEGGTEEERWAARTEAVAAEGAVGGAAPV